MTPRQRFESFLALPDVIGGHVSTWSETYRHACEAWWLINHTDQQGYLQMILKKRGKAEVDRLVVTVNLLMGEDGCVMT